MSMHKRRLKRIQWMKDSNHIAKRGPKCVTHYDRQRFLIWNHKPISPRFSVTWEMMENLHSKMGFDVSNSMWQPRRILHVRWAPCLHLTSVYEFKINRQSGGNRRGISAVDRWIPLRWALGEDTCRSLSELRNHEKLSHGKRQKGLYLKCKK